MSVLTVSEGAVVERVEASGAGRVFQRGEPTSLADEAVTLFGDDLAALGARGREYAVAEHGWETVFDRLFAVYRSVLRREVPPVLRSARPAGVR